MGQKKRTPSGKKKKSSSNAGLDAKILRFLDNKNKHGVHEKKLYAHFFKKFTNDKIGISLKRMEEKGLIIFKENDKIQLKRDSQDKSEVEGRVDLAASGVAYIVVEGMDKDVFIPRKHVGSAMQNDTVKVKLRSNKSSSKIEGEIIEIVKRNQTEFMGRFQPTKGFGFVSLDRTKSTFDIFIPESLTKEAKEGDYVVAQIINWEDEGKNPVGKIVEILTDADFNELEMRALLLEGGFNQKFPHRVEKEMKYVEEKISRDEIADRLDYRSEITFTIDPLDAKDFDDALSVKQLKNGLVQVGIHIADVAHYVPKDSALDKEAQQRTTSVYLPDRVCPMLPEKLSNVVCSLRPNEDKCAFSVLFDIDDKGEIVNYTFAKTIINSDRRYTYEEAQEVIEGKDDEFVEEILYLNDLAQKLREDRYENGAISFDTNEVRFRLDENAKPIEVYAKERKDAHLLVEDFMLLANTTVSKFLSNTTKRQKSRNVSVYRVHDKPSQEKLSQLASIASRFGIPLKFDNESKVQDTLINFMDFIKGKPQQELLSKLAIRCMAKAAYTTKNIGHFGLAFDNYTHFTSPIRRYPDVLVHRLLLEKLMKEPSSYTREELDELCAKSSEMEKKAQSAERSAIKYKQAEYLKERVGKEFDGIISGVISKGFFVELVENKCEGFVSVHDFKEDFVFEEEMMRLTGVRTRQQFQIGDPVKVLIASVNMRDKKVDFEYVSNEK